MKDGTRHSVLCVESSEAMRRTLEALLCAHDCEFASSARDAMRHICTASCDAYVLDYWMPGWSGPLLCREIRKRDPYCPVIVCGAAGSAGAGANAYVAKDDLNALASTLATLLALSDSDSMRAEHEAARVLSSELDRCVTMLATKQAETVAGGELERTMRARTFRTYIDRGGTRAHFERWWPRQFRNERLARIP